MSNTATAPEHELPPTLQSPDLVTAIRAYGCPGEHRLSARQETFSVGSSSACDVRISSEYVSPKHCQLVRRERHVRVHDLDSYNGTYFRGYKDTEFEIAPGEMFCVATTRLLALNEAMQVARPVLTEVLGHDRESAIDDVLVNAVLDGPILVVGPTGAGQLDLARTIHDISTRRNRPFVVMPEALVASEMHLQLIDDAQRGTLVISATDRALDGELLETILADEHGPRLVLLAPSIHAAMRSAHLPRLPSMSRIEIRPLYERESEIPRLLESNFARHGADIRLTDLRPENQHLLLPNRFGNLRELRRIAAIIAALVCQGSIRRAADALGMPRSTMQYWIKRFQLIPPLVTATASSLLECPAV